MNRPLLAAFISGAVLATLTARYGIAATVGLCAAACPVLALAAGLADAWRTRRTEWAGIDARHTTTRILNKGRN